MLHVYSTLQRRITGCLQNQMFVVNLWILDLKWWIVCLYVAHVKTALQRITEAFCWTHCNKRSGGIGPSSYTNNKILAQSQVQYNVRPTLTVCVTWNADLRWIGAVGLKDINIDKEKCKHGNYFCSTQPCSKKTLHWYSVNNKSLYKNPRKSEMFTIYSVLLEWTQHEAVCICMIL